MRELREAVEFQTGKIFFWVDIVLNRNIGHCSAVSETIGEYESYCRL
jgi:hypothetical protein